jgi:hypothetical protein
MSEKAKLMTFDEFRTSTNTATGASPLTEAMRQQGRLFRDAAAAEQAVRLALLSVLGWVAWKDPDGGVVGAV